MLDFQTSYNMQCIVEVRRSMSNVWRFPAVFMKTTEHYAAEAPSRHSGTSGRLNLIQSCRTSLRRTTTPTGYKKQTFSFPFSLSHTHTSISRLSNTPCDSRLLSLLSRSLPQQLPRPSLKSASSVAALPARMRFHSLWSLGTSSRNALVSLSTLRLL